MNLVQPDYSAQKWSRISPDTVEATPIELTVVLPTYNEVENVFVLIDRISRVLRGIGWEMVFVDDNSPDGTSAVSRAPSPVSIVGYDLSRALVGVGWPQPASKAFSLFGPVHRRDGCRSAA